MARNTNGAYHSAREAGLAGAFLLLLFNLCACASRQPPSSMGEFATATTQVTAQTQNVYQVVQNQYAQAEMQRILADYAKDGFHPERLRPFIPADVMQVRIDVLQALSDYAQGLAAFASDDQLTAFDDQTKVLGQQLLALNTQKPIPGNAQSGAGIALFAVSVNAVGRFFIEYKREAGIKQIVDAQDGNVRNICTLLAAEIGGSAPAPDDGNAPPRGLRNQLWNEYTFSMVSYDLFIDESLKHMTPTEQFNAINQLAILPEQRAAADAMLIGTAKALTDLADTHTKLKDSIDNPGADIQAPFAQLSADVKSTNDFYASLQAKQ
jgi:hypothetical protein